MTALALIFAGCPSTASPSSEAALRRLARRVLDRLATDPQAIVDRQVLAERLAEAERLAAERGRPLWRQSGDRRERAWSRVEVAAAASFGRYRERRGRERQQWPAAEEQIAELLRTAATRGFAPVAIGEQSRLLAEARTRLELARSLAASGRFGVAVAQIERGRSALRDLDARQQAVYARFADPANRRLWRGWIELGLAEGIERDLPVVVVDKLRRLLQVFWRGRPVAHFDVELGVHGLERKLHSGDRATPEGRYRVIAKRSGRETRYHKALLLDYPGAHDLERLAEARRTGRVPEGLPAGDLIEIHGDGGRGSDWTDGCVALANPAMDRLFEMVETGSPVVIVGTSADAAPAAGPRRPTG